MKRYFLPVLLLLFAGQASAQAPKAPVLTLQQCVEYALGNNQSIKKAELDEQSAEYLIKETKGAGLPQLNATGQAVVNPTIATMILQQGDQTVPIRMGTKYNVQGGIELQQLLFSQTYFVGLQAAKSTRDLYALRTRMSQEDVIYNIGSAYYQALQIKEQFNTIDANYKRLEQLEKLLDLQRKNDLARKVDVNRITVNKTNLENQRQTLAANYQQAKNALKFFMGLPIEQELDVANTPNQLDAVVPNVAEDPGSVVAQRIDYQLLNKQRDLSLLQIKSIKAGYYPTLAAFARYNEQAQRSDFSFFNSGTNYPWFASSTIGLQLSVPIFDGFQKRNRIKQAEIGIKQLDWDMKQLSQHTHMSLDNARRQMSSSQLAIQNQERNVQMAQEVFTTTNNLYKEGLSPLTDLLDAETALRESETNLNTEKLKYKIAQLDYLRARGELSILTK